MQLSENIKLYPTEYQKALIVGAIVEYIDTVNRLVSEAVFDHSISKLNIADVYAELPSALLNQCIRDAKSIVTCAARLAKTKDHLSYYQIGGLLFSI